MPRFLVKAFLAGLLLVLLSLGAAACDVPGQSSLDDDSGDIDTGKARQLFQASCRSCHSLADANAAGVFGPDLDQLQPDADTVRRQIEEGGGGMPQEILTGEDADLVARYVAQVAGTGTPPEEQSGSRDGIKPSEDS